MACMWCVYFYRSFDATEGKTGRDYLYEPGECIKDPIRVPKTGADICGSFAFERLKEGHDGLPHLARWYLDGHRRTDKTDELKAEVRRLKAANKALREKLKSGT